MWDHCSYKDYKVKNETNTVLRLLRSLMKMSLLFSMDVTVKITFHGNISIFRYVSPTYHREYPIKVK